MKKKLGVALLGLGSYNTTQVATALQSTKKCVLVGAITGTAVKASMWMRKYGLDKKDVYNYDHLDEVIENKDIDIIYVSVPNAKHLEFVCKAANAKKHIICEKPLGMNRAECIKMISVCEQNNVKLSVGYRMYYDPYVAFMKSLAEREGIIQLDGNLSFDLPNTPNWRLNKQLAGGGALLDIGIYGIYTACYISQSMPEFVEANIKTNNASKFNEVEESVSFTLYFEKFKAKFNSSYSDNHNWLKLKTSKSESLLKNAFSPSGQVLVKDDGSISLPEINQVAMHLDDFAYSIMSNEDAKVRGEDGLRDSVIIEALYTAAKTGRREPVKHHSFFQK